MEVVGIENWTYEEGIQDQEGETAKRGKSLMGDVWEAFCMRHKTGNSGNGRQQEECKEESYI